MIWKTEDKMGGSLPTCSLQSHLNNAFHGTSWPCSASLDNDIISMIPQVTAPALVSSLWLPVCQSGWEISFRLMGNPSSYPKAASALSSYDKFYPERSQHFLISSSFTEKMFLNLDFDIRGESRPGELVRLAGAEQFCLRLICFSLE